MSLQWLLNPKSKYIKTDMYLLILSHVISEGKLSHCFLLSKVVPNTQIIQKTISKRQIKAATT